jgi:DNA-binding transcriptional ArsR family regulator
VIINPRHHSNDALKTNPKGKPTMFKDLDPILHSQLRLAVMSLLIGVREAEFTFLKEKTNATAGNLSVQISKLKEAGYIDVIKQYKENYPQTICRITRKGIDSFEAYVAALQSYMKPDG